MGNDELFRELYLEKQIKIKQAEQGLVDILAWLSEKYDTLGHALFQEWCDWIRDEKLKEQK